MSQSREQSDFNGEDVPLVAIGASAGGLEPLEHFFAAVSDESGIAYVIVQHLSPDYRSMMNELLARKSQLPIRHIDDGMKVQANTVYLNRPNMYVELDGTTFRTSIYKEGEGLPHLPIDRMFASLAKRTCNRTIAVVLSGSGSDGSRGAHLLHEAGAAVLVQSMQEAAFPSMPRSVLLSGSVDRVLDAADMPGTIREIFTYGKKSSNTAVDETGEGIRTILDKLEERHKVDFSDYKSTNVNRRIVRRLHLRGHASLKEYDQILSQSRQALDELYHDMLIGVTEFYRDQGAMTSLRELVLDKLAKEDSVHAPLKIWVSACATGEEAYTIAIEVSEALRQADSSRRFRIIATDIHAQSVEFASRGCYTEDKLLNVPEELRERYFVKSGDTYTVDPTLRQKIIFSVHNVLADPPFMNLDLVSCRNLLIYLKDEPQASVISMFLFGLRRDGYLLLGASESIGKYSNAFATLDKRWNIFRKNTAANGLQNAALTLRRPRTQRLTPPETVSRDYDQQRRGLFAEVNEVRTRETLMRSYDALLKRYAPSSILMTADGKILNWFGNAHTLIDTMNNLAEWNVQEIVHPDLHFAINVGIEKLRQGNFESHVRRVVVNLADGTQRTCTVEIETLEDGPAHHLILAKIKVEAEPETARTDVSSDAPIVGNEQDMSVLTTRIHELENDLRLTEETLQHITERLEASGEELQASNEELQASNEELQASNEELQSSNEELHAVNEELLSVSSEHERKIDQLSDLNQNTELVLRLLHTGVILLDTEHRIIRFSELIERDFLLQPHDVDRSIHVVGPRLDFMDLNAMLDGIGDANVPQTATGQHDNRELKVEARRVFNGPSRTEESGYMLLFRWT